MDKLWFDDRFKEVTILAIFCLLKNECYLHGKFDIEEKSDIKDK